MRMPAVLLCLSLILTMGLGCSSNKSLSEPEMKEGELVIKLCSRGCYQYLIKEGEVYYSPVNLSKDMQVREEFPIRFTGNILETTKDIQKPNPVDVPIFDFSCNEIELTAIERQ